MVAHANKPSEALIEKIADLSVARLAEVEDFVDFLRQRDHDQGLTRAVALASAPAFAAVWDNSEDNVYDDL